MSASLAILAAGSYGTALAMLTGRDHDVVVWARSPEVAEGIDRVRGSPRYLSDFRAGPWRPRARSRCTSRSRSVLATRAQPLADHPVVVHEEDTRLPRARHSDASFRRLTILRRVHRSSTPLAGFPASGIEIPGLPVWSRPAGPP